MKLGRRGFLGFLGGAAVAGPGVAKRAAVAALADLNVPTPYLPPGNFGQFGPASNAAEAGSWATSQLRKLVGRSAQQHEYFKRHTTVMTLDPDLHAMRSIALHAKIRAQQARTYERGLRHERDMLHAHILGWFL